MAVYNGVKPEDVEIFLEHGYRPEKPRSAFETRRFKGKASIILYRTGKLLIQGTSDGVEHAKKIWEKKGTTTKAVETRKQIQNITGSDECLKGDTFGGIIVASVYAQPEERDMLQHIGVHDSKRISDTEIPKLARKIRGICEHKVIALTPKQYNERLKGKKVTDLLNELHHESYIKGTHVVDKYPGCTVGHEVVVKAETKFVEVAAASILARDAGLRQLAALSKKLGFEVPKGSTHVQDGLQRLKRSRHKPEFFVKMDFKNVKLVFS